MSADSNPNLGENDFKRVSYKNKLRKSIPKSISNNPNFTYCDTFSNKEACIKRISEAKRELLSSDLFDSVKASLNEGLSALNNPEIFEIICLGLGKFGECITSRYQFALLLSLKELYNVDIHIYDPIFNDNDVAILKHFDIKVLSENFEGKYKICDKKTRLFYLPHCPKQMTNNLLWVNWGLNLNYGIIVANSFNKIIESCTATTLRESGEYISKISPYTLELAVINSFKYYEVFNDTAIHVFPNLEIISNDLWDSCGEPEYSQEDTEFITKSN